MEIKEYLDKNLPNLNWNILPQIFEDNGVELTEEIEKYLKETPENTNWNVAGQLIKKSKKHTNLLFKNSALEMTNTGATGIVFASPSPNNLLAELPFDKEVRLIIDGNEFFKTPIGKPNGAIGGVNPGDSETLNLGYGISFQQGAETGFNTISYIMFPGNVGDVHSVEIYEYYD